jgi:cell division protein FtsB
VNISDSTRPTRQMSGVLDKEICETTHRSSRSIAWRFPSRNAFFFWVLIVTVSLFTVSGCGRAELESAKQQIEKLSSEVKTLTDETARLKQEISRLSDESKALSDKNTLLQRGLDELNKSKAALSAENTELKKKNSAAGEEIASLKREKNLLAKEVEELKKGATATAPPPTAPATTPTGVVPGSAKQPAAMSPCDAVVAFMRASEQVVRQQKGAERAKSLEQVKQQYAPKMQGAPEKAIKAAEDWVKEGSKFWDQVGGSGTLQLLELRNTVLGACGKSPEGAGFK